ncbi:MAG: radical SAM protein [Candidatus Coatesbacteria bacterium]|nr:radical SAM protein [Candidatus Coatesbacteria bacterium]
MKKEEKVVLLVPPGSKKYLRDYYCGKVSKANYYMQPIDLLMQTSWLHRSFELLLFDIQINPKSEGDFWEKIKSNKIKAIFMITGSASWAEDYDFIKKIREKYKGLIAISGDIFMGDPVCFLDRFPELDIIITDFTTPCLESFLNGKKDSLENIFYRDEHGEVTGKFVYLPKGTFTMPRPRYEIFDPEFYSYPFSMNYPMATVLTDFGCPYQCKFCTAGIIGFKERPLNEVANDLHWLKEAGYNEIYFVDQTFGAKKERREELLDLISPLKFSWSCYSRADIWEKDDLIKMKESGCHTMIFGVESGNESTLQNITKGESIEDIRKVFSYCKEINIRRVGTFILGFPGETSEQIQATINLAISLDPDYASFNIPIARPGTNLTKEAVSKKLINQDVYIQDQSGSSSVFDSDEIDLIYWQNKALREFYLRPSYLWRTIKKTRNFFQLKQLIIEGIEVLNKALWKGN